ncbi:TIGR00268 family protein [Planctomycetota bacterium]|nr:TIGR00268 family protein [Planctomycetota bacterium]
MDQAETRESAVLAQLRGLAAKGPLLVAYSAGVDSTYLLDLAVAAGGNERVLAVTADSPSLARSSLAEAIAFTTSRSIRHQVVATDEFAQPDYVANDGQRCYHCKSALFGAMTSLRTAFGREAGSLLLGAIADDLGEHRPGLRAAAEAGALWPLAVAGMTKAEVRQRSKVRGLPTWDRPAEPCLSSRIPYGEPVEPTVLVMIEAAELVLREHGFATCRARHHRLGGISGAVRGHLLRIEVPADQVPAVVSARTALLPALRRIGYANVTVDLAGFASGGYDRLLPEAGR